jgi:hypothetical protein
VGGVVDDLPTYYPYYLSDISNNLQGSSK